LLPTPAVKTIKDRALRNCSGLTTVILGEGLEEIGQEAFNECTSLHEIVIPNAVKTIKDRHSTTAILGEGLEEIGQEAFNECTSLHEIVIPNAVKTIDGTAFNGCSNLTSVVFCDKIKLFVSCEAMRDWWNQGVHERSLSTYSFLVKCNIPKRLSLV
jgi:hypothetical protein